MCAWSISSSRSCRRLRFSSYRCTNSSHTTDASAGVVLPLVVQLLAAFQSASSWLVKDQSPDQLPCPLPPNKAAGVPYEQPPPENECVRRFLTSAPYVQCILEQSRVRRRCGLAVSSKPNGSTAQHSLIGMAERPRGPFWSFGLPGHLHDIYASPPRGCLLAL